MYRIILNINTLLLREIYIVSVTTAKYGQTSQCDKMLVSSFILLL